MTKKYNNDRVWGLEGYGISDVFNIDTNIESDFEKLCIQGSNEEILEMITLLSEDKALNFDKEDLWQEYNYNSIEDCTQFSKVLLKEQLEYKDMSSERETDVYGLVLSNIVDSLQHYGIKVENILTNSENVNNIIWNEICDEEECDGGFFNSLLGIYNKEISYSLMENDYNMQGLFIHI